MEFKGLMELGLEGDQVDLSPKLVQAKEPIVYFQKALSLLCSTESHTFCPILVHMTFVVLLHFFKVSLHLLLVVMLC